MGALENIDEFRGRKLINISGGNRKVFLFEEIDGICSFTQKIRTSSPPFMQRMKIIKSSTATLFYPSMRSSSLFRDSKLSRSSVANFTISSGPKMGNSMPMARVNSEVWDSEDAFSQKSQGY